VTAAELQECARLGSGFVDAARLARTAPGQLAIAAAADELAAVLDAAQVENGLEPARRVLAATARETSAAALGVAVRLSGSRA
jgi:hypothetical protein